MEMQVTLMLKNGYRFRGTILEETETHLIINDVKDGRTAISKDMIAVRTENGGGSHEL